MNSPQEEEDTHHDAWAVVAKIRRLLDSALIRPGVRHCAQNLALGKSDDWPRCRGGKLYNS